MSDVTKVVRSEPGETTTPSAPKRGFRPLRAWPAVGLIVLMVAARLVPPYLEGGQSRYWIITNMVPALLGIFLLIWWLTASRANWKERVFGFLGVIAAVMVTFVLGDVTMRGAGTMYLTGPMGLLLFGLVAVLFKERAPMTRTGFAVLAAFLGCGYSLLLRSDGYDGDYVLVSHWRWTKSAEERLLANSGGNGSRAGVINSTNVAVDGIGAAFANPEWPAFRGADRSGRVVGPQIATNWSAQAPRQLWKIPVGPAWSSFAIAGKFLFTQEQRGPMEAVVCYDADTGQEIWRQEFEARLDDPMGGPGPRATPTLATLTTGGTNEAGLFVMGSTGILLRLDPANGKIVWQQNVKELAGREKLPMWGYAGSPLVTKGVVIVWGGGAAGKGLLAFDAEKGALRWSVGAAGVESYCSPQLNTIAGEDLVLLVSEAGLLAVDPASGKERLNYDWKFNGYRAQQPAVIGDTVVMYSGMGPGSRAIQIKQSNGELAAEELWTVKNLKPDFTDFVVHEGHLFGIDGGFMTCVDVKTGQRKWRDGRYGKGEVVLLENSKALLVAAEDGRVALVEANATEFKEVASFKALEGKTWNHPVVVGNRLYVRNAQEAACFELPLVKVETAAN
ncbi:MAG TPA: PQQ-binding-like beta-propeller repeat protein [Verrucomicrobiae bacterium]